MKLNWKSLLLITGMLVSPITASANTYLGEFCLTAQHPDGIDRYFKLGISFVGDDHYSVNGKWIKGDLSAKSPVHGNLEIIDGKIEISTVRTGSSANDVKFRAHNFKLDGNFNGTVKWLKINRSDGVVGGNDAPVVLTDCATLP